MLQDGREQSFSGKKKAARPPTTGRMWQQDVSTTPRHRLDDAKTGKCVQIAV